MNISRIAIVWNDSKQGAAECRDAIADVAKSKGIETQILKGERPLAKDALRGAQLCCVIGGDGTILGAVESAVHNSVPIFGINLGKLGYLANYSAQNIAKDLEEIFSGNCRSVKHALLECTINGDESTRRLALNDVAIKAWENFKIAALRVESSGTGMINTFRGDGLIFTTPTGSTAYSLGAGGPLIHSEADVFALTPLCPHTLSNRTVVFPRSMEIIVSCDSDDVPVGVSIDGATPIRAEGEDFLHVKLAQETVEILQPPALSEFEILRTKLRWV